MKQEVPFNKDIEANHGYLYTTNAPLSSCRANSRITQMIEQATDYRNKNVVDVGCGDGTYTVSLKQNTGATSVVGIDPSANAISVANQNRPAISQLSFRAGFARDLIADQMTFDIAVYRGVIHHTLAPAEEIAAALRLANEVVFVEPNGLNGILKVIERTSRYHREHGERSFTSGQIRAWVEAAGGRVVTYRYFGLVPFFCPDWMVRLGIALEPLIERLPIFRNLLCGQILMVCRRK